MGQHGGTTGSLEDYHTMTNPYRVTVMTCGQHNHLEKAPAISKTAPLWLPRVHVAFGAVVYKEEEEESMRALCQECSATSARHCSVVRGGRSGLCMLEYDFH